MLVALVVVVVGWSLTAVYRAARAAREDTRQDLIKLGSVPEMAKSLTDLSSLPTNAFMDPFAEGRSHPLPLAIRAQHTEIILAQGHERQTAND